MTTYICYYRVSTGRQEISGLGLDAQRAASESFAKRNGAEILRSYTEIESGTKCSRPVLAKAMSDCRASGAVLLVAKLDRLARNMAFMAMLMESDLEFVAVDMPFANKLTIWIMAALAEHESQMISDRVKAAMAQAKLRGMKFGSAVPGHWEKIKHHFDPHGAARASAEVRMKASRERYQFLLPAMKQMRQEGKSLRQIAKSLNESGYKTSAGRKWLGSTVQRVLAMGAA
jgi:DNA invertase Pin-like site-specific DNA recombinase